MTEENVREIITKALIASYEALKESQKEGKAKERVRVGAYGDSSYYADLACERAVIEVIDRYLGDVTFVTEESGIISRGQEYYAVIDPIDGSTNMYRNIKYYCCAVALSRSEFFRDVFASGIMNFGTGEIIIAVDTKIYGAQANPTNVRSLDEALMSVDPRAIVRGPPYRDRYLSLVPKVKHMRFLGSAILEQLNVALGSSDGFVCLSRELRIMDFVPAIYVLRSIGLPVYIEGGDLRVLSLLTKEKYGVITCANEELFRSVLTASGIS